MTDNEFVTVRRADLENVLDHADLEWCRQGAEDRLRDALEAEPGEVSSAPDSTGAKCAAWPCALAAGHDGAHQKPAPTDSVHNGLCTCEQCERNWPERTGQ